MGAPASPAFDKPSHQRRPAIRDFVACTGALAMSVAVSPAAAQSGQWAYCGGPLVPPMPESDVTGNRVSGQADRAKYVGDKARYTLFGDAKVRRGDRQVSGERLRYDDAEGTVKGDGGLRLREPGVAVEADRGQFQLADDTGEAEDVNYRFATGHLHGEATRMFLLGDERTRYESVTVTTCNPGDEIWELRASEVTVDEGEGFGEAWNARLALGGVPVAYTPWLRFPVGRERQTGFLAPVIGSGDEGGFRASAPFYWNIAPNYDATITPTFFADRGAKLDTQFRYLEPWITGELNLDYLPSDDLANKDRWAINQRHDIAFGEHLRARVRQQRVSDVEYPDDFDTSFNGNTERFLESEAAVSWSERDWSLNGDFQNFQTIDDTISKRSKPLERAPSLDFRYDPARTLGPTWVDYDLEATGTRFAHPNESLVTTGDRLDVTPRVSLPLETLGYFFEPAVRLRHTSYDLDRRKGASGEPETLDRTLPIYSLDAGLFFERPASLLGDNVKQTLEPRVFFVHTPQENQQDLPRFDTQLAQLTFGQLFEPDRFTGADRVGDQTRASFGVTSRFVDEVTGREYFSLSGGGLAHFEEREVTIGNSTREGARFDDDLNETGLTALVSEAEINLPGGLSADVEGLLDPNDTGNYELRNRLRYKSSSGVILNGRYRMRQLNNSRREETANASAALPVSRRWTLLGAVRVDLIDDQADAAFAGIQYQSCCFALRGAYRTQLDSNAGGGGGTQRNDSIMFELELKGLGGFGDELVTLFRDGVPGYNGR